MKIKNNKFIDSLFNNLKFKTIKNNINYKECYLLDNKNYYHIVIANDFHIWGHIGKYEYDDNYTKAVVQGSCFFNYEKGKYLTNVINKDFLRFKKYINSNNLQYF